MLREVEKVCTQLIKINLKWEFLVEIMEDLHYKDKKLEFCGEYDQWQKKSSNLSKIGKKFSKNDFCQLVKEQGGTLWNTTL